MRVGIGYDVHQLVEGRPLIIGGVEIEHDMGLLGHSDADVLVHAIMDSLLGAAGLGVIGQHFPDTDEQYKGISSMILLGRVKNMISARGFKVGNIDCVVVAQKPKIQPYFDKMKGSISSALNISLNQVNIKATTTEYLGFEGREEGIKAIATCFLLTNQ